MLQKVFFWLKIHLGFSVKESRGFLLLVPILLFLVGASKVVAWAKNRTAEELYQHYLFQVDSLERAGIQVLASPLPPFNPVDTIRDMHAAKVSERIKRLPFSEADSVLLQIVPGIGALTAGRIIKHREGLGGFIQANQLNEVYGLKPEVVQIIWEYFDFDTVVPRQLALNTVPVEVLAKHPYISYQEAKVIVAYRLQHGPYTQLDDLLKIKIFRPEWVTKIGPYLDFEIKEKRIGDN